MVQAAHWSKIVHWNSEYFSAEELACRSTGQIFIHDDSLNKLEALRQMLGKPMIVNSAYRSPEHNKKVGGAKESMHLKGKAFDISMSNHDPAHFERCARQCGFTGFGFYPGSNFIHIDTGTSRTWGKRFPERKTRFTEDKRPIEKLGRSTTVKAGTAVGTVAAAELATEVVGIKDKVTDAQDSWQAGDFIGIGISVVILVGVLIMIYRKWVDAGRPKISEIIGGVL